MTTKKQAYSNPINRIGDKAYKWPKGVSGNPEGRIPNSVTTLLKQTDNLTTQQIADKIVEMVLKGEYSFVREYLDRTDGKVADKHLNLNVTVTPELLEQAQQRLLLAQDATKELLDRHSVNTMV